MDPLLFLPRGRPAPREGRARLPRRLALQEPPEMGAAALSPACGALPRVPLLRVVRVIAEVLFSVCFGF